VPDPTRPFRFPHHPQPAPGPVDRAAPAAGLFAPPPAAAWPEPRPLLMSAVSAEPVPAASTPAPYPPSAPYLPPAQSPPRPQQAGDLTLACAELSDLVAAKRHAEVIDLAARLLPRARAERGAGAPLVGTIGTIYARTLLKERRFRDALPEYRLLAAAAEGGPHGPQGLDHRYRAAECLEQLGQGAEALAEYHALLAAHSARLDAGLDSDPGRVHDIRERIGLLRAAGGDAEGGWEWLLHLLLDRERLLGPHHEAVRRLRQSLDQLQQHRTGSGTGHPAVRTRPQPPATPPAAATPPPFDPRSGGWPAPGTGSPYPPVR
jgi:hypothetical protein